MFRAPSSASLVLVLAACGGAQKPAGPPPCPLDAVRVATQDDVDALASCTSLSQLTIRGGGPLDLAPLAKLERVRTHLVIGPTLGLDHVSLPALREVGGDVTIQSNATARGVFLPVLATVEDLTVAGNGQLTTLSLPRLTKATLSVVVEENGSLEIVDLIRLQATEALVIKKNAVLATLDLPATVITQRRLVQTDPEGGEPTPETIRALRELQTPGPTNGGGDHE